MDGGEKRYNYKPFLRSQGNSGKMHVRGEQRKAGQETLEKYRERDSTNAILLKESETLLQHS